ncbi:MAG: BrxA family protein [Polyangiaceae bacterium]
MIREQSPPVAHQPIGGNGPNLGRDTSPPSARNSSKGALLYEAFAVFHALSDGTRGDELRAAALETRLFRQTARETRRRIWDSIHWRYFAWNPPRWVLSDLCGAATTDPHDPRIQGLLYLHYARRDRLAFEFVTEFLFRRWQERQLGVRRDDVLDFLASRYGEEPVIRTWSESTRKKLAGNVLSALRDFGVLTGVQRKVLQRPAVPPEVALHVCRLLHAEGLRGRALLEAPDWRLFLWEAHDISMALARLAQRGEIQFERSGRTVILEVPALPTRGES